MPDLLLFSDTESSPALRHEVPVLIGDPFLYAEVDGRTTILTGALDRDRIVAARPDAAIIDFADVGFYELLRGGQSRDQIFLELVSRAVAQIGVRAAIVDPEFPVAVADRLRADGVQLTPDHEAVALRRRVKSPAELAGIRRAQKAAEAGMAAAAAVLRDAVPEGDKLVRNGAPLTAEDVRAALREACAAAGAPAPREVIVASVWQGFGHDPGSGPLPADLPIQIDLWPRDEASGCWADMTRTFVVGDVSAPVRAQEALVSKAFTKAREAVRPGVTGRELHALTCDIFEAAGHRTQRTGPGDDPNEGFQFSLGHGVGLAIHEDPGLGQLGRSPLVAGDVIAVEPGLWEREIGGVRYEDLLLVTEDGCEVLTQYPYDLTP
ncbi:MAG TPA: M24 family metallopeptidase [Baekduia sp.]|uniref:M24 family metallopeptidase n=1 Tax=Baekduia sp. TaxID=2600305 RepID=UPI002C25FA84|nr:M24 family metallopeptidase [Baekduia sp.]HMJ36655.1 M24 family metallopeptidase [Baekduia sp.]